MNLGRGFKLTKRFYPLILVPIVLDLLQLGDILRRVHDISIKFTIPSAVPSLIQVLADPPHSGNGLTINLPYSYLGGAFMLLFILFLLVSAFVKGGFLGCVLAGINEQDVNAGTFIRLGKKYFSRFLLQVFIMVVLLMVAVPFFFVFVPFVFPLLIGVMLISFYLIFWDYIIVAENAMLIDAARTSWKLVGLNLGKVFSFILPIVLITAFVSVIANTAIAISPVFVILAIIAYAYYGTAVVAAVMSFYTESLR